MDAPNYPPAAEFISPIQVPIVFSLRTASLADLMSAPAAWAIVLKYVPRFAHATASPAIKASLSNLSVEGLVNFGMLSASDVAAIDREIAKLPRTDWPANWPTP